MGKLYAPTGARIIGTLETVMGIADFTDAWKDENGEYGLSYSGGTDIDWNSQVTVTDPTSHERLFLCENGEEWRESQLTYREKEAGGAA